MEERTKRTRKEMWLDVLPVNIRERIAQFATGGRQCSAALQLAESSSVQRSAVLRAIQYTLIAGEGRDEDLPRWACVVADQLQEIRIGRLNINNDPGLLEALLRSKSLRTAKVPGIPGFLKALQDGGVVKNLCLELIDVDHSEVLRTLAALRPRKLQLHCSHYTVCVRGLFELFDDSTVHSRFPELESLEMDCCEGTFEEPLRVALGGFQRLREVAISAYESLSDETIMLLRQVESVKLFSFYPEEGCAVPRIGSALTVLDRAVALYHGEGEYIGGLQKCKRLSSLKMGLQRGVECHVGNLVPHLPHLRTLCLRWNVRMNDGCHTPKSGTIFRMVASIENLESLGLVYVGLSMDELKSILKHMGSRLKQFSTCVVGQAEPAHERLLDLLLTMSYYNRSLEKLTICHSPGQERLAISEVSKAVYRRRLGCAKGLVLQHAPLLDEGDLDLHIQRVLQ